MNKIFGLGIIILVLAGGSLFGQDVQKPYSYTFDRSLGECVFAGVSLEQAWSAALKILMQDKFRIVFTDKAAGTIRAERRPASVNLFHPNKSWNYELSLYFEQRENGAYVAASIMPVEENQNDPLARMGMKKAAQKEEKRFFDGIAELLYENAGK